MSASIGRGPAPRDLSAPRVHYTDAPLPQIHRRLSAPLARVYSTRVARDLRDRGLWPPSP